MRSKTLSTRCRHQRKRPDHTLMMSLGDPRVARPVLIRSQSPDQSVRVPAYRMTPHPFRLWLWMMSQTYSKIWRRSWRISSKKKSTTIILRGP